MVATMCSCKGNKNVVLTSGLKEEEIFRIDSAVCTKPEMMLYLVNTQKGFEKVYGTEIWQTQTKETTIQDSLKESVLAKLSRIKVMVLLADEKGVSLTSDEKQKAERAAKIYFDSLTPYEKETLGLKESDIIRAYEEYALANKLYAYLVQDVNPEISDDDARTITVSHILIKNYHQDANGHIVPYSASLKTEAYKRAQEIRQRIMEGEEFEAVQGLVNESDTTQISFRKGEMGQAYEEAAFLLANDEVSRVVETPEGYYIIKCINTFNKEETDANKLLIVEEQKKAAFESEYEAFLGTLIGNLNHKSWDAITLIDDPQIQTDSFFEKYELYFEERPLDK